MKSKSTSIVKDGISYNQKQIKKLESEIAKMMILKKKGGSAAKINEIIKWDKKLISDFRAEIANLKKRL